MHKIKTYIFETTCTMSEFKSAFLDFVNFVFKYHEKYKKFSSNVLVSFAKATLLKVKIAMRY